MFTLLESKEEIVEAQKALDKTLQEALPNREKRNIGYPGGTKKDCLIYTDYEFWYYADKQLSYSRQLNWFGAYKESGGLNISVEVNTPFESRKDNTAGFYAKHVETDKVFLFHSGRIGGGTKGVSKENFVVWTSQDQEDVYDSLGKVKEGFIVMPVEGGDAIFRALNYVKSIAEFKDEVRRGLLQTSDFDHKRRRYRDYIAEARGERKALRKAEITYVTRHGDIVDALKDWRNKNLLPNGRNVSNSQLIDLLVEVNDELIEVYEVKTSASRQYIYGGIGQLLVHGANATCQRTIVLPSDEVIAEDLTATFKRLNINVIRYELTAKSAVILGAVHEAHPQHQTLPIVTRALSHSQPIRNGLIKR